MILQSNLDFPSNGIKIQVPNTKAFVGETELGTGVLCVAERYLIQTRLRIFVVGILNFLKLEVI